MKRITLALAVLVSFALVAVANADTQYPGNSYNGLFVAGQTVTSTGTVNDQFMPGETVVFQAFAISTQTHKLLTKVSAKKPLTVAASKATLRYFFVRIPLMDDLKLVYGPAPAGVDPRYRWTASWAVPALYPTGVVHFQILARTWTGKNGAFAQIPVALSQLTITTTPQVPFGPGPTTAGTLSSTSFDLALFGDTVNGTHPLGAPARPVGCTQTNVYKRGEQVVVRAFGYQLSDGAYLSIDNVTDAHFSIPGQPDIALNWGQHGPTGQKVWYWTAAWNIPVDYPLGDINVHISFKNLAGKTAALNYPITIIPNV